MNTAQQTMDAVDAEIARIVEAVPTPHMRDGISTYLRHGVAGSDSFILNLMRDSFSGVFRKADDDNRRSVYLWASWLYNDCPSNCRREHVDQWIADGGMLGRALAKLETAT
jgi:hypothetical protein